MGVVHVNDAVSYTHLVHSGTKYLEGHNDTLSGFLVVKDNALYDQLYNIYKTTGACLSAIDSWLLLRGIKTLAVRMEQHQKNALAIAHWLEQRPEVEEVYYIGLDSRPDKELIDRQCSGDGGMISFRWNSAEKAVKILESVKPVSYTHLSGYRTERCFCDSGGQPAVLLYYGRNRRG